MRSKTLWHYTNVNAFFGMVESGEIWASASTRLNDESEYVYGLSVLADVLSELTTRYRGDWRSVQHTAEAILAKFTERDAAERFREELFVVSASIDGDSLSQWVHYAGVDGVAVGLSDVVPLYTKGQLAGQAYSGPMDGLTGEWIPMFYQEEELKRQVQDLATDILEEHSQVKIQPHELVRYAKEIRTRVEPVLLRAKHPSFQSEGEMRFVCSPMRGEEPEFRPVRSALTPYLALKPKSLPGTERSRLPITRLRLGPTVARGAERTFSRYLSSRGYGDVIVDRSQAPYRSERSG